MRAFERDVVVIGGGGHVGLPLAIAFASRGLRTVVHDISAEAVESVRAGVVPFLEPGAEPMLRAALDAGLIDASTDAQVIAEAEHVVVVLGTPVDEHLNPDPSLIPDALRAASQHLRDGQLLVLRSTVYPGTTALVEDLVAELGLDADLAFCPERIAEHKAMTELFTLPQIVSATTPRGVERARALFEHLTDEIVELEPAEAELAKLFTNAWRYVKFATVNQFFMMANDRGLDFDRIRTALAQGYPRAQDIPGAGFAAGPCLLKDTMQLAAFTDNAFGLGHAAMLVNEGLPLYVVSRLEQQMDLRAKTVGILGMAFKAGSDDIRSSLSYKLRRVLRFKAAAVLSTDPHVPRSVDPSLLPLDEVLERADVLIVAAPHDEYRELRTSARVVDIWNLTGGGVLV